MPIKVLLADDREVVRKAISRILMEDPAIELVGEATDYNQAAQMVKDLKPHIVVMDLHLPGQHQDRHEEVKSHLDHGSKLIATSFSVDEKSQELAKRFGAVRFLDKMNLFDELVPAILQLGSADSGRREN